MIVNIHYFLLNENFSPEYAAANFNGKESENNQLHEWEDELEIKDILSFAFTRKQEIPLEGQLPTDEFFSVLFKEMFVIELTTVDNQIAKLGVSESILDRFDVEENENNTKINIYIKDYEPHGNPVPGIYVASKEFPKELIF